MKPSSHPSQNALVRPLRAASFTALFALTAMVAVTVHAQTGYFISPSIAIAQLYDDNIFFTIENEESAAITRATPGLELGFDSQTLSWVGRYRVEAEQYRDHSELNSSSARRFADVSVEYLPTSRLTLSANADYTKTNTPVDLSVAPGSEAPGLLFGRAQAERSSISPAARYRFSRTVSGSLVYTRTHDELSGAADSDTHRAVTDFQWQLSQINTVGAGYIFTRYQLDDDPDPTSTTGNSDSEETHVPWLGLLRQLSASSHIIVRAGPRLSSDSTTPYLLFEFRRRSPNSEILLEYERNESILLGDASRQEFQRYSATLSRRLGLNLDVRAIPTYARLKRENSTPDVYRLILESEYRFNPAVSLVASYRLDYQEVEFVGGNDVETKRNLYQLGIRFRFPRPTRE